MFDLEPSIAAWRRQMLAGGIKFPQPLQELELHLREAIEQQIKSGLDPPRAFAQAVQQIGPPEILKREFQKARALTVAQKRTVVIAGGILTILVGIVLLTATLIQKRDFGALTSESVVLFVLGLILILNGAAISFLASKPTFLAPKQKA